MDIVVGADFNECGYLAAQEGIQQLKTALSVQKEVNIILATGMSQFSMLACLRESEGIDWQRVNAFHLDEYVGLPIKHPASFRTVLWKEFFQKLPVPLRSFTWVDGENTDPAAECARLGRMIREHPIDIAFVGIGENGHLAFNDPPANFLTDNPYIVVTLDEKCKKQQMGEGWFKTIADVPDQAISMSMRQIMQSKSLIITCPDARKADAVTHSIKDVVSPLIPGSVLRCHPSAKLYLDTDSASGLGLQAGSKHSIPVENCDWKNMAH